MKSWQGLMRVARNKCEETTLFLAKNAFFRDFQQKFVIFNIQG